MLILTCHNGINPIRNLYNLTNPINPINLENCMPSTALALCSRILREGYGPGAWHGPDMKAAIADVTADQAFARPAAGRHNIAEIALHHAFYVRAVRGQLAGATPEPFVIEGEDWFDLSSDAPLSWDAIQRVLDVEYAKLADVVSRLESGTLSSPLPEYERMDLVLGITCHAVYHAGQTQLVKRFLSTL